MRSIPSGTACCCACRPDRLLPRWGTLVSRLGVLVTAAVLTACASAPGPQPAQPVRAGEAAGTSPVALPAALDPATDADPFPSTYRPAPGEAVAIVGATLLTGTGSEIREGTLLMRNGRIEAVGQGIVVPAGYQTIDAHGRWLTPGIIDAHSHLGVAASPGVSSLDDTNEMSDPNTAEVWAEHSLWPQDPKFDLARAAGVTAMMILPGSANLFGGRTVTVKNVPSTTMQGMKFPAAPYGLKMACGENPKRVYLAKGRAPQTRMAEIAGFRRAWLEASDYGRRWDAWRAGGRKGEPPKRDLRLDTLLGVLRGQILVQNHCYRADEMATMLDIAREFGFHVTAFHHASEAYKIAPLLAREKICVATWASSWGSKLEAFDGIEENAALIHAAGGCAVIHSDDGLLIQRLNQEAAIALTAGRHAGLNLSEADAIEWLTANPARMLGILDRTGTLESGKMADVVLWSADPFSVYAHADKVWIDGVLSWDRTDPRYRHQSDFELG